MRLRFVDIGPTSSAKNEKIYTLLFYFLGNFTWNHTKLAKMQGEGDSI